MKKLTKIVERETFIRSARGKVLKIELTPLQAITFREHGKKTRMSVPLAIVNKLAIIYTIMEEYRENLKTYNEKRKAGISRLRKPKKPTLSVFTKELKLAL